MLTFGLLMGGILFVAGMATYVFAPRVGPNPIFGVRVGYSYANREVWDQTNRLGGILLALVGTGVALLGAVLQTLGIAPRVGMGILTAAMMLALLGMTVWLFVYARRLARDTPIVREVKPVEFRWAYLMPVLVTFALLVALAAYWYPQLPADRLATHFDWAERPNGWQTRDEFFLTFLGLAAFFVVFDVVIVFIATREPLIAFGRWGARWRLDPERGLLYTGLALALMNLIFVAVLWDVAWFNTRGAHAFPLSLLFWIVFPLVAVIVGMFFVLARREK
ncbi:MAG: SdpI family protein [Anaerolineae bacterium]|nr:SdpI family protein [Anaerolineae bacterium]